MVRSAQQQAVTPPNDVEPVTTSLPEGTLPETSMIRGPLGSSLFTVIFADLEPRLIGWKRIGTWIESPASTVSGYDKTFGARNSAEEEVMLLMVSVHFPLLFKVIILSTKDPMQALPKLPASAITTDSLGGFAVPDTFTILGPAGSLLCTVIVADLEPRLVG